MRINESRIRRIIREELEAELGAPATEILREIGELCETELMNKSLVMKGPNSRFMNVIVDLLNEMLGEERVELIIYRSPTWPPHHDAVDAFEWISEFCRDMSRTEDADDLSFRVMCVTQIADALSNVKPFEVKVDAMDLPEPHPGGALGANIDDDF